MNRATIQCRATAPAAANTSRGLVRSSSTPYTAISTGAVSTVPDDRLEPRRRRARVGVQPRHELAGAVAGEEAHGQPEQVAEQIELHRGARPDADPEGEQVVGEVDAGLEHADADEDRAEEHDRPEAVLHGADAEPAQHRRAQVLQAEAGPAGARAGAGRAGLVGAPMARSRIGAMSTGSAADSAAAA